MCDVALPLPAPSIADHLKMEVLAPPQIQQTVSFLCGVNSVEPHTRKQTAIDRGQTDHISLNHDLNL